MLTKVRFVTHIFFAVFVGLMFQAVGYDAALGLNNAGMLFFNLMFIVFTAAMPTVVTCKFYFDVFLAFIYSPFVSTRQLMCSMFS
jgi:hypothetical protein